MPSRYPAEFRRKVLDLIEAGKPIAEVAASLGVSDLQATDRSVPGFQIPAVQELIATARFCR